MRNQRVIAHNVVYMYAKPTRASEQVSQTLLGARVAVLQTEGDWSYVESDDTYCGWVESRWLSEDIGASGAMVSAVFAELRTNSAANAPLIARLSIGSRLVPGAYPDGYLDPGALTPFPAFPTDAIPAFAVQRATEFLGTPYLWGGSSAFGLDCSGIVQFSYRLAGLILRRDAHMQRDDPRFVPVDGENFLPGDLVFFGLGPEKITHIGMYHSENRFIHAAGGAGTILTPVGDDRYWPRYVDARRLDPARANEPVTIYAPAVEPPKSMEDE